jgi:hypothetical protein
MKTQLTKSVLLLFICMLSMHGVEAGYVWTQKANFGGGQRFVPFSFSIGDKGYVGSGITFTGATYDYIHTDFWPISPVIAEAAPVVFQLATKDILRSAGAR